MNQALGCLKLKGACFVAHWAAGEDTVPRTLEKRFHTL